MVQLPFQTVVFGSIGGKGDTLMENVYGPKLIENISLFEHSSSMIIEFLPSK